MLHTGLWDNLAALVLAPAAVWLTTFALGLLVERVAGLRVENALLIPLGFCVAVAVCLGVYTLHLGNSVLLPVLCLLVAAGLLSRPGELRGRLNAGWPLLAAIAAYLLFDASVILTGHWTFTGYHLQDDTAYEFLLANHLKVYGTAFAHMPASTANSYISSFLSTGYPLGAQAYLGALSGLVHAEVAVIWQGYLSSLAGIGAMAASTLSGRTMDRRLAALVGFLAISASLTYQYALQGSVKEIGAVVAVLCAMALIRFAVLELRGIQAAVLIAIPLAAILIVYNAAGLPYAASLAGSALLAAFLVHRRLPNRSWIKPVLVGAGVFAVFAAPAFKTLPTFFKVSTALYTGPHAAALPLGQLLRPLPLSETVGVWLTGDYRVQVPSGTAGDLELIATVLVLALLIPGIIRMLIRREPGPLLGILTTGLVLLIVYPRAIPYAQAKLLAIASPIVVLGAAQGLAAIRARRLAPVGFLLAGALAVAVIASDGLAYHHDPVAPTSRMIALRQVGEHLNDSKPVLVSEFEEFAKYFAYPARLYVGTEYPSPENLDLRVPGGLYDQSFDLDQEKLSFVESFPYILVRRSPTDSRPPANYRLSYQNEFYELWERTPTPHVLEHLSLQPQYQSYAPIGCPELAAMVKNAPAASKLVVAQSPVSIGYDLLQATVRSRGWIPNPNTFSPNTVLLLTPGAAGKIITAPEAGLYRIWVQGTFARPLRVTLDGHTIGTVAGNNTPDEWLSGGQVRVSGGRHALDLFRPGGGLAPGDGWGETIGHVALVRDQPQRMTTLPLSAWRGLCGKSADWVELVSS